MARSPERPRLYGLLLEAWGQPRPRPTSSSSHTGAESSPDDRDRRIGALRDLVEARRPLDVKTWVNLKTRPARIGFWMAGYLLEPVIQPLRMGSVGKSMISLQLAAAVAANRRRSKTTGRLAWPD